MFSPLPCAAQEGEISRLEKTPKQGPAPSTYSTREVFRVFGDSDKYAGDGYRCETTLEVRFARGNRALQESKA